MICAAIAISIILLCPFILVALLRPALMCVDGGSRQWNHVLAALIALIADVITAFTIWAALTGWPKRGEWTVSDTLERLCVTPGKYQDRFIGLARKINGVSPTGRHIKAAP